LLDVVYLAKSTTDCIQVILDSKFYMHYYVCVCVYVRTYLCVYVCR
jgi:hypothetical protein